MRWITYTRDPYWVLLDRPLPNGGNAVRFDHVPVGSLYAAEVNEDCTDSLTVYRLSDEGRERLLNGQFITVAETEDSP